MENQSLSFVFNPSNSEVQVEKINDEPWFVAKDVCRILEIHDTSQAVKNLDDDEKLMRTLYVSGQDRDVWLINQSGLYALMMRSNKPQAKPFRKWITSEVIPSILKTGSYTVENKPSKFRQEGTYIDAYHIPYTSCVLESKVVRMITIGDLTWFSINDVNNAIGSRTDSTQTAKMLNRSGNKMAAKILLFGNTQPAWFCTQTGMNLIIASSRVLKARQHKPEPLTSDAQEFPFNLLGIK